MKAKPETTAHVSVKEYCFTKKEVKGIGEKIGTRAERCQEEEKG